VRNRSGLEPNSPYPRHNHFQIVGAIMIAIASFFKDPAFVLMAASFTLLIGLGVGQIDLISRAEGGWRWVAAVPTLVIALYVLTNSAAPRSAWPEALMIWTAAAAVAHAVVWFTLRQNELRQRGSHTPPARTIADAGIHGAGCASSD
jgi:hypothetical protein